MFTILPMWESCFQERNARSRFEKSRSRPSLSARSRATRSNSLSLTRFGRQETRSRPVWRSDEYRLGRLTDHHHVPRRHAGIKAFLDADPRRAASIGIYRTKSKFRSRYCPILPESSAQRSCTDNHDRIGPGPKHCTEDCGRASGLQTCLVHWENGKRLYATSKRNSAILRNCQHLARTGTNRVTPLLARTIPSTIA
jgi:hypothetical protein